MCFAQVRQAQTRHERSRVTEVPTRSVAVISANQDAMALLRVVVVTLCALAVCGATAAVATADSDDAAAPAGGFTISGKVGAAPKRSGLSVWLNGRQHHTLTLMNGSFRFTDLPAGARGWCAGGSIEKLVPCWRALALAKPCATQRAAMPFLLSPWRRTQHC